MPVPSQDSLRDDLRHLLSSRGTPLVIAHRGTTLGSFPDNTVRAAIGALRSGADVIETDVIRSVDGEYFLFHTGFERKLLDEDVDVRTLTAQELEECIFRWNGGPHTPGIERLDTLLDTLPEAWVNIDRSWGLWPHLLDHLTARGDVHRLLLKSPPRDKHLAALAAHPMPFLYFPIVRTREELATVEAIEGINLIGAELLAAEPEDDFADPETVAEVARRHPLVVLNALNLDNNAVLYLRADDAVSVLDDPALGWGRLADVGATAIQTDWPHLLRKFLEEHCG